MPHMRQRHMTEGQQQQEPKRRQPDTGREPEGDHPQQPDLERLECLEIRAHPLVERGLQRRHHGQPEWLDKAGDAIGRHQRSHDREQTEEPPAPRFRAPASRRECGLRSEEQNQSQPEHEAAVQIGPQSHQRQQPTRRRRTGVARREQLARPYHQQGERQQVRPDQQMPQHQRGAQSDCDQRRKRFKVAQQIAGEERHTGGEANGRQQHQPTPPGSTIDQCQNDLRQPFMRHPNRAGLRMREWILHRQGQMSEHPAAGGYVQIGIGIVEQRHRLCERAGECSEPRDQRPGWDHASPRSRHRRHFPRHI